jgi:hypothetical protein
MEQTRPHLCKVSIRMQLTQRHPHAAKSEQENALWRALMRLLSSLATLDAPRTCLLCLDMKRRRDPVPSGARTFSPAEPDAAVLRSSMRPLVMLSKTTGSLSIQHL